MISFMRTHIRRVHIEIIAVIGEIRAEMILKETLIELGSAIAGGILFFFGSLLMYGTAYGLVFGSRIACMFAPYMTLFSGGMIFVGILGLKRGYDIGKVTWLNALGATSLYAGCLFLYFGLKAYLFPRFPADVFNSSYGLEAGSFCVVLGTILVLLDVVSKKKKWTI